METYTQWRLRPADMSSFGPMSAPAIEIVAASRSACSAAFSREDVVETAVEMLPGGHWMKITPRESVVWRVRADGDDVA